MGTATSWDGGAIAAEGTSPRDDGGPTLRLPPRPTGVPFASAYDRPVKVSNRLAIVVTVIVIAAIVLGPILTVAATVRF